MKKAIIILPIVMLFALMACTSSADKKNQENSNTADLNMPGGMLHTAGNKIINEKGQEVRLAGVNICSLEWNSRGNNVLASTREVFTNWNCNLVRLPLSQDRWFGRVSDWSTPKHPDGGKQYRKIVDDVIEIALSYGKYIVLDLHWSNAGEWGKNIGQHYMPDENSLEFWLDVAGKYSNNSAVLFGLYNEPHDITWEVWRNGGTVNETENRGKPEEKNFTYITPGHQKIVNEIRALGANNIIAAGGIDWAYDLRGIASSYALTDTPEGNGIVYDSHIYPFKEWDGKNHDAKVLCIAGDYPVLIGEIGIDPDGQWGAARYPTWLSDMLDWIDRNRLNWAGWCFHIAAPPNMISDWKYTPTKHHGAIIKQRLLSYPNAPIIN
jgi:endoglucanase